ncbi:hypothetical protein BC629DRAFT_1596441 [Irpex lacteus]|nr:hypothetical protein BC629DRAFT_1596441 [Irpex lacteus]
MSSNNKPPEDGIDHQVQYVLSGLPTGWAAMAKEVRDFDEEKLVLKRDNGGRSVLCGTFRLSSRYPALPPDRMDAVIHALDRIATQTESYRLSGSTLMATNRLPSTLLPFIASANDIRVNVACNGYVKFLAVENPSPQARLRIHHFRAPQVTMWAVYEIAAALPLLLQLSLGLFFAGLCYFTVAVHSSIGYTTLPLVVGWALCFFTTTLLPFFFPRCPYKTALLKVAVIHLHRHVSRWAVWLHGRSSTWRTQWFYSMPLLGQALHNAVNSLLVCLLTIPDEHGVLEDLAKDVAILLSVDAIQANDELLSSTVFEALHYTEPHWKDVVDFTMGILSHRTLSNVPSGNPGIETKWPSSDAFPLAKIRPRTKAAIVRNLSEFIVDIGVDFRNIDEDGTHLWQAFALVMSAAHDSPEHVISSPNLTSFLMCYLNHPQWAPKLLGDWMRLVDGTSNAYHDTGPVSLTTFQSILATLIRLEKSLQLRVPGGAEAFKQIF